MSARLRPLIVSSRNQHKLAELQALLAPLALTVREAAAAGVPEVEETGTTFADNALLKAAAAWRATGEMSLADDSGLTVDALDGAPGVYSSRFAGPDASDQDNNRLLLDRLRGVPDGQRGAAFVATVALLVSLRDVRPAPRSVHHRPVTRPGVPDGAALFLVEGSVRGRILRAPRGRAGFGYDPLFFHEPSDLTFAELPAAAKNELSHRGQALRALRACMDAAVVR